MSLLDVSRSRVVVGDGAMGTELQRAGLPIGECGDRWNLEHPDRIEAIHAAYVAAGSEAIITNSFGANRWVLGRYGLADQIEAVNSAAAAIARRAAGSTATVLGDIGPCGGFLRPLGDVDPADLQGEFTRQARALLDGGADGVIVETMSAVEELVLAIRAARAAGAPFIIASMAFDCLPNGNIRTMMGVSPEQAARASVAERADIVGANCGTHMTTADFAKVVTAFRKEADRPVMIQANAGSPELEDGHAVYRLTPAAFADGMGEVVAAGAAIVGGCCGTTPEHIAALRSYVRRMAAAR
ncbi:MAG TPA: homocysteine S-methyltransferase family protein [Vicinamibacterales bacterium]|jgi:5-methyltetrahydrofolate--homocysteine methyltransferase